MSGLDHRVTRLEMLGQKRKEEHNLREVDRWVELVSEAMSSRLYPEIVDLVDRLLMLTDKGPNPPDDFDPPDCGGDLRKRRECWYFSRDPEGKSLIERIDSIVAEHAARTGQPCPAFEL